MKDVIRISNVVGLELCLLLLPLLGNSLCCLGATLGQYICQYNGQSLAPLSFIFMTLLFRRCFACFQLCHSAHRKLYVCKNCKYITVKSLHHGLANVLLGSLATTLENVKHISGPFTRHSISMTQIGLNPMSPQLK